MIPVPLITFIPIIEEGGGEPPPVPNHYLLEDGDQLLLENGDLLLLQA